MPYTTVDLLKCSLLISTRSFRKLSAQPKRPEMIALIDHGAGFSQVWRRSCEPKSSIPMALVELITKGFD
jgi:hypothetical protein